MDERGRSAPRAERRSVWFRWSTAAVSAAVAAGLAACAGVSASEEQPAIPQGGALAVVVGGRGNMPAPALAGRSASARDIATAQHSRFSLVVADGAPFQEGRTIDLTPEVDRGSIDQVIAAARARTPESDLLAALGLAGRQLAEGRGLRTLVVLDSGLSTAGALSFTTPGMLDAHPRELADALSDAQQLPDLSGVAVVFQGLGDTAPPQPELDPIRRAQLVAIWTAIVRRAGATNVHVDHAPPGSSPPGPLPAVSTVETGPGYRCDGTSMTLSGGPFAFRPDSDEFIDHQAAVGVLRDIAGQLRSGGIDATMFGTTATVGEVTDQVRFSDERAQAVADVLIDLDVPIPQLHVEGLGSEFEDYVADRDERGSLVPAAAALNRTVFIEFSAPVACG